MNFVRFIPLLALVFFGVSVSRCAWAETEAEMRELLDTDRIPPIFLEQWRALPDSPDVVAAKTQIDSIIRRLYPENDFTKTPFRVVISDNRESLIGIIDNAKQPVLVVSVDLLQLTDNLDQLAYSVATEIGHVVAKKKRGTRRQQGKMEDLIDSTIDATKRHITAGYNAEEATKIAHKLFNKKNQSLTDALEGQIFDVNRVRTIENQVGAEKSRRGQFANSTELPAELRRTGTLKHLSVVNAALEQSDFAKLSTPQKLDVLKNFLVTNSINNTARTRDWVNAMRKIRVDRTNETERAAHDQIANALMRLTPANAGRPNPALVGMFGSVAHATTEFEAELEHRNKDPQREVKIGPAGDLVELELAIRAFRRAKTSEEALQRAREYLALIEKLNVAPALLREVNFSRFPFPNVENLDRRRRRGDVKPPSWHTLLELAARDRTGTIARALFSLGIDDPRLLSLLPGEAAYDHLVGKLPIIQPHPRSNDAVVSDLVYDSDGNVIKLTSSRDRTAPDYRVRIYQAIDEHIETLVTKTAAGDADAHSQLKQIVAAQLEGGYGKSGWEAKDAQLRGEALFTQDPRLFVKLNQAAWSVNPTATNDLLKMIKQLEAKDPNEAKRVLRKLFMGDNTRSMAKYLFGAAAADDQDVFRNPLMQELLNSPHFTNEDRRDYLIHEKFLETDNAVFHFKSLPRIREVFDATEPKTAEELYTLIRSLKADPRTHAIINAEVLRFLTGPDANTLDRFKLLSELEGVSLSGDDTFRLTDATGKKRSGPLGELKKFFFKGLKWPTGAEKIVDAWQQAQARGFFGDDLPKGDKVLESAIKAVTKLSKPEQKRRLLTRLLSAPPSPNPDLRAQLRSAFVNELHAILGDDPNTADYAKRFKDAMDHLSPKVAEAERLPLYEAIGKKFNLQRANATSLQERLTHNTYRILHSNDETAGPMEATLRMITRTEEGRKAMIDYLTDGRTNARKSALQDIFRNNVYVWGDSKFQQFIDSKGFERQFNTDADYIYDNFWKSPMEARAGLMDVLVFPPDSNDPDTEQKGYEYIIDKLLPPGEPYAKEARTFVDAYHRGLPDYQKRLFLAAALVAAEKGSQKKLSIGARLAIVLELLGPAETKLGQAIHSHSDTPDSVRDGMERLKHDADEPTRWELMDLYEKNVPEHLRKDTLVKEILGSASYYIVASVQMKDENGQLVDRVVALLRPHALERSQNGFKLLADMIKNLEGKFDPDVMEVVREMVADAEAHASTETDSRVSKKQTERAREIYDGQKIKVGDKVFTLRVPSVLDAGETFRFMERAPGTHFNELPESTEAEKARKRDIAKAYLAFELGRILSGGVIDTDRHGAQMRIEGDDIYLFDFGRLALEPPTPDERKLLGEAIGEAFEAVAGGKEIAEAALDVIRKRKKKGLDVKYLHQVNQALLALQDFRRHLSPSDNLRVLQSALTQGVHPEIIDGAVRAVMAGASEGKQVELPDAEKLEAMAASSECIEVLGRVGH